MARSKLLGGLRPRLAFEVEASALGAKKLTKALSACDRDDAAARTDGRRSILRSHGLTRAPARWAQGLAETHPVGGREALEANVTGEHGESRV
jgi:hypothetical protein